MATIILVSLFAATLIGGAAAMACKHQRLQAKRYARKRQIIGDAAAAAVEALESGYYRE
jgi:hypothetical protein